MIQEWRGFIQKRNDGSEKVNYDNPDFSSYIYRGWIVPDATWANDPHFHGDVELLCVTSGSMAYSVDGKEIPLNEGDTIFVNSGHIHYSIPTTKERANYVITVFHPRILCASNVVESKYIQSVTENTNIPYILFKSDDPLGYKIHEEMLKLPEYLGNEFLITKHYFEIWEDIYNKCLIFRPNKNYSYSDSQVSTLKIMLAFIKEEYSNPITLDDIAGAGNVSKTFCNTLFNKYTDQTPIENLTRFRVGKVADLLREGNLSMSEIAFKTGFSSQSYMSETFRKYYGESPKEFRKKAIWTEA